MDSRQLQYFRAVVDHGSFTEAAAALHMTQPSLSLVVRRLEEEFGLPLLIRGKQGARTTEAGAHLYENAVRILDQMAATADHLRSLATGHGGRVVLSSAPIYNWEFLPGVVSALREDAPDLDLVIQDPPPKQTISNVLSGEADVGVVPAWNVDLLRERHGDQLAMHAAIEMPLLAILPPTFGSTAPRVSLEQLRDEAWLVPASDPGFPGLPELLEHVWQQMPHVRPRRIHETSTLQTALPLVAGGMGVALMPSTVRQLAHRAVIVRELSTPVPPLVATVLWRRDGTRSPALTRVIRLLAGTGERGAQADTP
ncbi:LysR family transcriptional regulator [Kocuria sp. M1R5S2]|uniref:LysR family transcriptional regulator n=1 Tax=Kocuria rhizosphaerae TaxID=3376285 RepID=UPI0037BB256E